MPEAELEKVPARIPARLPLGLAVGPGLMIFYVLTLLVVARYPITRTAHRRVRAELDRRRGVP